jgi:hypothetical protein
MAGLLALILASGIAMYSMYTGVTSRDWRTASHEPTGIAPDPARTPEALVQVYAARAWGWRGYFGVHSWIATKPGDGRAYTVYELIGWRLRHQDSAIAIHQRAPDARWYGAAPQLIAERRGANAEPLIARIDRAARDYPYGSEYSVWPGPNSNTFIAWIARSVPELELDLPPTAIGKDFLGDRIFATAPSGSGLQVSLFGLLGMTASGVEGLELNVLGLTFGVAAWPPALKLPMVGRLGPSRRSDAVTQ